MRAVPSIRLVLAEVNRVRVAHDLDPLDAMPKGRKTDCEDCPVAVALEGFAGPTLMWPKGRNKDEEDGLKTPRALAFFMHAFDTGRYPELEA